MNIFVLKHTKGLIHMPWLGRKTQRFSGTNEKLERLRPFGTAWFYSVLRGSPWLENRFAAPGSSRMQSVVIVHCTDRTNRQIHHDPKDTQVVKRLKVYHITFTDRQHSHTTREYIRRSVRVIQLVNPLRYPYRPYDSWIHYTICTGNTTREYITQSVRVIRLVSTLHDLYGLYDSWIYHTIRMDHTTLVNTSHDPHNPWIHYTICTDRTNLRNRHIIMQIDKTQVSFVMDNNCTINTKEFQECWHAYHGTFYNIQEAVMRGGGRRRQVFTPH